MLDDPDICFKLKVELAALVDAGEVLVKTCYFLEGDGYVALKAYDRMKAVELGMNAPTFPNVIALVSQKYADPVVQVEQLEKWVNYEGMHPFLVVCMPF